MTYVLDTNIVVAGINEFPVVKKRMERHAPTVMGIPLVVLAELYFGAYHSLRRADNLARVRRLREQFAILPMTEDIMDRFGSIKSELLKRGLPKTDFDLVVVATALETGATLVTNERGLKELPLEGLAVEDWLSEVP